jgi:hypothetical protein
MLFAFIIQVFDLVDVCLESEVWDNKESGEDARRAPLWSFT